MTLTPSQKTFDLFQNFHVLRGRGREMGSAHQKNVKHWALCSIQQSRFMSHFHGPQVEPPYPLLKNRFAQNFGEDRRGTGQARVEEADKLTTSSCEQHVKPRWRWRCGGVSKLQVHSVFPSGVCSQVWPTAPDMLGWGRLYQICWGVVARKFRNLTWVSVFAQASRSQEDTQESTTHLLKLEAYDRAILLTSVSVFAKFKLCVYIYLSM